MRISSPIQSGSEIHAALGGHTAVLPVKAAVGCISLILIIVRVSKYYYTIIFYGVILFVYLLCYIILHHITSRESS